MRALVLVVVAGCFTSSSPSTQVAQPRSPKPRRVVALSDALGFLPAESTLVAVVELEKLRPSPAWSRIEPTLQKRAEPYLGGFATKCEFDPITSLKRAAIGLREVDTPTPSGVIVLRGYRRELVMRCLELARTTQGPSKITIADGVALLQTGSLRVAVTFADDTTLVIQIGPNVDAISLAAVIDGGAPLRATPRFVDVIAKGDTAAPLWLVIDDAKLLSGAGMGFKPSQVMASGRLVDGASAQLRMRLDDPAVANTTATTLQAQVASAAMFFDELAVFDEDADLVVKMRMNSSQLEMVLSMLIGAVGP